jgi:hypothetical protein
MLILRKINTNTNRPNRLKLKIKNWKFTYSSEIPNPDCLIELMQHSETSHQQTKERLIMQGNNEPTYMTDLT